MGSGCRRPRGWWPTRFEAGWAPSPRLARSWWEGNGSRTPSPCRRQCPPRGFYRSRSLDSFVLRRGRAVLLPLIGRPRVSLILGGVSLVKRARRLVWKALRKLPEFEVVVRTGRGAFGVSSQDAG